MQVSPDGVTNRDEKVFRFARERNIPLVMLTSGSVNIQTCLLCSYFEFRSFKFLFLASSKAVGSRVKLVAMSGVASHVYKVTSSFIISRCGIEHHKYAPSGAARI